MKQSKYRAQFFLSIFIFSIFFCVSSAFAEPGFDIELPAAETPSITAVAGEEPIYLAPYIRYAHNLDAKDAKSALAQRSQFLPYDVLALKKELGTYWFLISFDEIIDKDIPTGYLDLGNFLPKNSHVLVYSKRTKRWQVAEDVYTKERKNHAENFDVEDENSVNIFHSGLYDLTSLRDGGELLIYSPGVPSIWFSPKLLSPAKAPLTFDRRLTPFILLALFVLMIFIFWRGAKEEGDARIWASLLCLAVLVQFAWGVPQNAHGRLDYLDMVGVVASCLAIFFLPHIGRHLLVTEKKSPHFDSLLQFLAIPAIFPLIVLFVPIPEFLYVIRFAPLWGLYALVLFVLVIPFVLSGRKGAKLYAFFCLSIGVGCLSALALRYNSEWYFLNYLGLFMAMVAIFLAPRQTEKNIFDEQLTHEDIVSAFAENNSIMRDALYRVELKLRDPFDRIMRETCFLDFDLKTEELAESLALLNEKEFGDRFEKHALNAVDELSSRAKRLQEHTSSLVLACRDLSGMLGHITDLAQKEPSHNQGHELFNVKTLITQACDNIRAEAQDRQVGLGWYIAPNIGLHYRGDKASLEVVLSLLLRDAIRATEKGMISVRVRRANSPNPGHIVFTISDSGKGRPPVQRSILTLVKAWELSSAYNGEVELRSSPGGLSFSFSMQCLAMDQNGEKPLSYASLDDIVLSHGEATYHKKNAGSSGGNILFSRESGQEFEEAEEDDVPSFVGSKKEMSILIISPLAIQRQNFVYYLNTYETWEALDVDSALAFYEKKPASLVLVHSALSASGCSAVIAGIRLLEDSLGIAHAPCVGLYQSVKDMEFLRLAGCDHTLPDNIGRDDLCTAVAEILGDRNIQPITDIDAPHTVVKKVNKKVKKAVEKRLNTEVVHVGSVVDGAVSTFAPRKYPEHTEMYEQRSEQAGTGKANYEDTLDFREEKTGVFSKLMQSFKLKPHIQEEKAEDEFDAMVGEPQPLEAGLSGSLEKKDFKPAETEEDIVLPQDENFSSEYEQIVEERVDAAEGDAEILASSLESFGERSGMRQESGPRENPLSAPMEFLSFQEAEQSAAGGETKEKQTDEEAKITLSFLPGDTSYEVAQDEDLPPFSLQNALENMGQPEEIPEHSVFVQSGLIMFSDEAEQTEQTGSGERGAQAANESDTQKNAEETEPAEPDGRSGEERGDPQEERNIAQNEENKPGETLEEQVVLELSHDMLVDVKEEKKKPRKRKEEKEEKTGLDILLDYSPKNSGEQKNDEEENRSHKKELIQLSFFPIDDENENK